jgi:hypothetical protein
MNKICDDICQYYSKYFGIGINIDPDNIICIIEYIIGIAAYGMRREKFLLAIQKMSSRETGLIYDLLFHIFKFEECKKTVENSTQCEDSYLVKINQELKTELQSSLEKNDLYERKLTEIKSENNMMIEFLKDRIILLEQENRDLKNGKGIEGYIMELSNRIEEERTRTNSLLSLNNKLESPDEQSKTSFSKQETEDVNQLKEEIAKLTRQNTILIEKCERSSVDSEELNYID